MNQPAIPPLFEITWTVVWVLVAIVTVIALVTIARSKSVSTTQKVLWLVAVLVLPGIGAIAWLVTLAVERASKRHRSLQG